MAEPIVIQLSEGQKAEFRSLAQQEADARKVLDIIPMARNFAARAMVLALVPHETFNGAINVDLDLGVLTYTPAPAGPQGVP